ncbi:MAG: hypothetical protein HC914_18200 [Chloroflexaceae bacterium]|nr:hypothetical protein [Chloroflexaceae bacterium]
MNTFFDVSSFPTAHQPLFTSVEHAPTPAWSIAHRALAACPSGTSLSYAWATFTYGWVLLRAERLTEAAPHLTAAHDLFNTLSAPLLVLHTRQATLLLALAQGAGAELLPAWEALARDYEQVEQPTDALRVRLGQLAHYNLLIRPQEAQRLAATLEPAVAALGSTFDRARFAHAQASIASDMGDLGAAETYLQAAEYGFIQAGSRIEQTRCQRTRSWIFQRREQFIAAQAEAERALATFEQLDLPVHIALTQRSLGIIAFYRGQYDSSLQLTFQARARLLALERHDAVADCDMSLGSVCYATGQYVLAQACFRRSAAGYATIGSEYLVSLSQRNQALCLWASGQPAAAAAVYESLSVLVAQSGDMVEQAELLVRQGLTLRDMGNLSAAMQHFQQAQALYATLGNLPSVSEMLMEQGWLHLAQHDSAAAAACFAQTSTHLDDRPFHRWRLAYGMGRCAELTGDAASALAHYCSASVTIAQTRQRIATAHGSSGVFAQARQYYATALAFAVQQHAVPAALILIEQQRALALQRATYTAVPHIPPHLRARYVAQRAHLQQALASTAPPDEAILHDYLELLLQISHQQPVDLALPATPPDLGNCAHTI